MAGMIGKDIGELETPCFLVDEDAVKQNCTRMIEQCKKLNIILRPHMKTHKTVEAGELMTAGTRRCIEVSTLKEAEFFADGGFDDILYTSLFTQDKLPRIKALIQRLEKFSIFVDSDFNISLILNNPLENSRKWNAFLKVNCGLNRAGVDWDSEEAVLLAHRLYDSDRVNFLGLYIHDGNNYKARGDDEIRHLADQTADKLLQLAERLRKDGIEFPTVAFGSTPSCSKPGEIAGRVSEFHPGNYVFYDAWQVMIGSCTLNDVACRVATRVLGHYPQREQLLVDCGFLALSHDGNAALDGSYCLIENHPELRLVKMSQEVGWMEPAEGKKIDYDKVPIGSVLYLIPYHSCDTAAMHSVYYVHTGGKVKATWNPCRGW